MVRLCSDGVLCPGALPAAAKDSVRVLAAYDVCLQVHARPSGPTGGTVESLVVSHERWELFFSCFTAVLSDLSNHEKHVCWKEIRRSHRSERSQVGTI